MIIRKATHKDLPELMDLFSKAREIMRACGNIHQWDDSYPSEEIVKKDIEEGACFVLCKERILATMVFLPGPEPTYAKIYDGNWLDDSPYHVIHRIAVREPGHNAAGHLFRWAFGQTSCIRIDTHKDNVIMHHILKKHGFTHCGSILLEDGAPREAFQKNLE